MSIHACQSAAISLSASTRDGSVFVIGQQHLVARVEPDAFVVGALHFLEIQPTQHFCAGAQRVHPGAILSKGIRGVKWDKGVGWC